MGMDWNDLHAAEGLGEVKRRLSASPSAPASAAEPSGKPEKPGAWKAQLRRNEKGKLIASLANVRTILANDERWDGVLGYCEFSYRLMLRRAPPFPHGQPGEWTDGDTARLRIWLSDHYKVAPSVGDALDGALVVAQANGYHPVRDYLGKLRWDGVDRLSMWIEDYLGATGNTEYLRTVSSRFLVGAVARIFDPGCKMDTALIFEGDQGRGKSTAALAMFDPWFCDAPIRLNDKDAYQTIQGVWCVELAELDSLNRAETTEAKSFFSQRKDRYRPSYGRCAQDFPRQCVFIGTTNQGEYLKDYTGNRRYWPVKCEDINIAALRAARDQLWAEAVVRYKAGDVWWALAEEAAMFEVEQDSRLLGDPWEHAIRKFLEETPKDFVTSDDVLVDGVAKPRHMITRADQNRIAPIMRALDWLPGKPWINELRKQVRGYLAPDHPMRKT